MFSFDLGLCVCVRMHVCIHRCVFMWFCAECEWAEIWSISVVVGGRTGGWNLRAVVWFPFPVPFFSSSTQFFYSFCIVPFLPVVHWPTLFLSFFFSLQKIIQHDTSFIKSVCVCVLTVCTHACMRVCVCWWTGERMQLSLGDYLSVFPQQL